MERKIREEVKISSYRKAARNFRMISAEVVVRLGITRTSCTSVGVEGWKWAGGRSCKTAVCPLSVLLLEGVDHDVNRGLPEIPFSN